MENQNTGSFAAELESYLSNLESLKPRNVVTGKVVDINRDYVTVDINFKSYGIIPREEFMGKNGELTHAVGDSAEVYIVALESEDNEVVLSREKALQLTVWSFVEDCFKNDKILTGTVVSKVKGGLQVDIGIPAFLPGSQIDVRPHRNLDKFLNETFEFKVLKITKDKGNIVLSRRSVLLSERDKLRNETLKVLSEGLIVQGTIKNVTDYGAFVDLGGIDGLLHVSDISWGRVTHPAEKLSVGQEVAVVVLKYDEDKERVSLGIKQLSEDPWMKVSETYPMGGKIKGKVISLTDYGAFIEVVEGIEGLVHVSDMSWTKKVRHPNKVYQLGDQVEAVILGIDNEQRRLNLGLKQLMPNPWETLHERHPVGSTVTGEIRSIMDFGVFVAIEDGIDGLVHISDFSWTKKIKDPAEIQNIFKKGDKVTAQVLGIDSGNERLSLGVKQLESDPWDNIAQRYPIGSKVKGKVMSIRDFGLFVAIDQGLEGLIHNSQTGLDEGQNIADVYPVGSDIECQVTKIDRDEHRISLSVRSLKQFDQGGVSDFTQESAPLTFGDLLREKFDNNN